MSELERAPIEGVVVPDEDAPFEKREDAEKAMALAWRFLQDGTDQIAQGRMLLGQAHRRQAWKILGYENWEECLAAGLAEHFEHRLTAEARSELAVALRSESAVSTRMIAEAVKVSHSTIVRDLGKARMEGRLSDEPDQITSTNGSMRKSTVAKPRRQDLLRTWRNAVDDVTRRTKTLSELCIDDRYRDRRLDLSTATRGDLLRAHSILTTILSDFAQHEENA